MRQFEAVVRAALGDPGMAVRVYAKDIGSAYQKIKASAGAASVTLPVLVPADEQTEEGRPD